MNEKPKLDELKQSPIEVEEVETPPVQPSGTRVSVTRTKESFRLNVPKLKLGLKTVGYFAFILFYLSWTLIPDAFEMLWLKVIYAAGGLLMIGRVMFIYANACRLVIDREGGVLELWPFHRKRPVRTADLKLSLYYRPTGSMDDKEPKPVLLIENGKKKYQRMVDFSREEIAWVAEEFAWWRDHS